MVKKDIENNIIYVSGGYDTQRQYGRSLHLTETRFITLDPWADTPCQGVEIRFKNRHMPAFLSARLSRLSSPGEFLIESDQPVQGIAPGQFAVIYDPTAHRCLGSGIISGQNLQ